MLTSSPSSPTKNTQSRDEDQPRIKLSPIKDQNRLNLLDSGAKDHSESLLYSPSQISSKQVTSDRKVAKILFQSGEKAQPVDKENSPVKKPIEEI